MDDVWVDVAVIAVEIGSTVQNQQLRHINMLRLYRTREDLVTAR